MLANDSDASAASNETSAARSSVLSERGVAVALITIARFLADREPGFAGYMRSALDHAKGAGLLEADLATLRLVIGAIGG